MAHEGLLVPGGQPVWELPLHPHHPLQRGLRLLLRHLPHRQGGCEGRGDGGRGGQSWEQLGHVCGHIGDTVWDTAESLLGPQLGTDLGPEQVAGGSLSLSLAPSLSPAAVRAGAVPAGHVPLPGILQRLAPPAHPLPDAAHPHPLPAAPRLQLRVRGGWQRPAGALGRGAAGSRPVGSGCCPLGGSSRTRWTQGDPGAPAGCSAGGVPAPTGPTRTSSPRERPDPRRHPWNPPSLEVPGVGLVYGGGA